MTMNGNGDAAASDTRSEHALKQEGNSKLGDFAATECWSKCVSQANATDSQQKIPALQVAAGDSGDPGHWLEGRNQARRQEDAAKFDLDTKASWEDIIEARATQGTQNNEGRVERMRREEAKELGLDPDKASWKEVNTARVQARIKELQDKYGDKK